MDEKLVGVIGLKIWQVVGQYCLAYVILLVGKVIHENVCAPLFIEILCFMGLDRNLCYRLTGLVRKILHFAGFKGFEARAYKRTPLPRIDVLKLDNRVRLALKLYDSPFSKLSCRDGRHKNEKSPVWEHYDYTSYLIWRQFEALFLPKQ